MGKVYRSGLASETLALADYIQGNVVEGPAIVWTPVNTVVVNPGQKATCDQYKNILITW